MNNNINLYIGKSGKYSPKMNEKRRTELKDSASESDKSLLKKLNNTTHISEIWLSIRRDYAILQAQTRLNGI